MTDQEQPAEPMGYMISPGGRGALMALLDTLPRGKAQAFWEMLRDAPTVAANSEPAKVPANRKQRRAAASGKSKKKAKPKPPKVKSQAGKKTPAVAAVPEPVAPTEKAG